MRQPRQRPVYTMEMTCAICHVRKPKRFCPGVNGEICSLCCGNEREVTVDCPFDCPYLQAARKHERPAPLDPETLPNKDIRVSEEFLEDHSALLLGTVQSLLGAVFDNAGAVDTDVRDALDAMIRTQRTLQSGLYYEAQPDNMMAARIAHQTLETIEGFRQTEQENMGLRHTRDSDVLTTLVFLQRLALDHDNGRPRGRAFMDLMRELAQDAGDTVSSEAPSLIVP